MPHAICAGITTTALATIDQLVSDGVNLPEFNKAVVGRLRELMLERVSEDQLGEAKGFVRLIEIFQRASEGLKNAVIPQLPLELAAVEAVEAEAQAVVQPSAATPAPAATAPAPVQPTPTALVSVASQPAVKASKPSSSTAVAPAEAKKGALSLVEAQQAFAGIVGTLKASLKLSLQQCDVLRAEAGKITIGAPNQFLCEKL